MKHLFSTDNLLSLFTLLLHDLLSLCFFLISHPLILAYLLLLSPYLLKLLFFLFPLLFSTFLLLLSLLTVSFHLHDSPSASPEFPLTTTSSAVLSFLRAELVADEAKCGLIEQICSIVFVDSQLCSYQMEPKDEINQQESFSQKCNLLEDGKHKEKTEEKNCSDHKHVKEEESNTKTSLQSRKEHSRRPSEILQRDGSMRKDKEWKRTLACKLFEERMTYKLCEERKVVEGAEEMDLLWEAYEIDAGKSEKLKRKEKDTKKAVQEKVKEVEEEEEEEDNDDAEEGISGQICCLQALKLSAGKMNLGVGRPSLVKISMALKGMAVFHRAGRRKKNSLK